MAYRIIKQQPFLYLQRAHTSIDVLSVRVDIKKKFCRAYVCQYFYEFHSWNDDSLEM